MNTENAVASFVHNGLGQVTIGVLSGLCRGQITEAGLPSSMACGAIVVLRLFSTDVAIHDIIEGGGRSSGYTRVSCAVESSAVFNPPISVAGVLKGEGFLLHDASS